jgi:hypothetical protein
VISSLTGSTKTLSRPWDITCPRCGEYLIVDTAKGLLKNNTRTDRQKANISGWLNENRGYTIYSYSLDTLQNLKTPNFGERADKILLNLEKITEYAGDCKPMDKSWISWGWCLNQRELSEFIDFLEKAVHRISSVNYDAKGTKAYKITANGWQYLENLKKINADSQQGFVAMWFTDEMQKIYDSTISEGILDAGYRPHKVDLREHNEKIDDEIIAQIRRSRFVLADFTGQRGGVYFEAGFGKGLGLEVFWSCRKDEIDNLHFDIRQYNCIDWEPDKLTDFRKRITNRIESVIGRGKYRRESAG